MTTPPPRHPAAYIRVAGADSADDVLVQRQRATVLSAARDRGWPEPTVYTDTGPSGWQQPGSALARLNADIGHGQCDAVITADLYRISRTLADTAGFAAHCASHDVTLETVDDADDPDLMPGFGALGEVTSGSARGTSPILSRCVEWLRRVRRLLMLRHVRK